MRMPNCYAVAILVALSSVNEVSFAAELHFAPVYQILRNQCGNCHHMGGASSWVIDMPPTTDKYSQCLAQANLAAQHQCTTHQQLVEVPGPVETHNVVVDGELAFQRPDLTPGDYVGITVRDTGEGMTPEIQSRVFEPFFTTKEVGKGTGLGLSTVYGIVVQNRGAITVESETGVGTTFRVLLPASVDEKVELPLRDEEGFLPTGSETILLVEDEPLVRGVEAEVLRHQGYTVIEAANGVEALEAAHNCDENIDLLVTDVVMPLMGGKELADRLKGSNQGIKVLYSTGYTENTALMREVAAHDSSLLHKPFGPVELADRVRRSLDGP